MAKGATGNPLFLSCCIGANILSSILVVVVNKWIYSHYGFPNMALTCIHFIMTSIGLQICAYFDLFNKRSIPIRKILPLSLSFCGFVVLTNLSLQHNTVGTYQLAKTMTTPCIIVIHTLFYGKSYPLNIVLSLIPITLGVFLNSYYSLQFNITGTVYAALGVLVTSMYQILVGSKQQELRVNSMQLLNYQAPVSAVLLACAIPFFEPLTGPKGLFTTWSIEAMVSIMVSAIFAFSVNLTIFWIIGNTSAVTYNMIGHTKFCLILICGFVIFRETFSLNQMLGVGSTMIGIALYTKFKLSDSNKTEKPSTVLKV